MAQNVVQNKDELYLEDAIVYIASYSTSLTNDAITDITGASWTNIGSIGELTREAQIETVQPESFNVEHDQIITKESENITFTVQEINQTNINTLMGASGQAVATSSTETSTNFVIAANTLSVFEPYKYPAQDFAGNATTPQALASTDFTIYVDGSTAAAVPSSAYTIVQLNDGQGNYGISFLSTESSNVDLTQASSISYNYTPRANSQLWYGGADELTPYMIWISASMADGRQLDTYYPEVHYVSGGAITDSAQASGAFKNISFTVNARQHESFTYNNRRIYKIEQSST
jgi:hypothetical protein